MAEEIGFGGFREVLQIIDLAAAQSLDHELGVVFEGGEVHARSGPCAGPVMPVEAAAKLAPADRWPAELGGAVWPGPRAIGAGGDSFRSGGGCGRDPRRAKNGGESCRPRSRRARWPSAARPEAWRNGKWGFRSASGCDKRNLSSARGVGAGRAGGANIRRPGGPGSGAGDWRQRWTGRRASGYSYYWQIAYSLPISHSSLIANVAGKVQRKMQGCTIFF